MARCGGMVVVLRDERLARTAECHMPLSSPPVCRVEPVFRTLDGSRSIARNRYAQLSTAHLSILFEPFADLITRELYYGTHLFWYSPNVLRTHDPSVTMVAFNPPVAYNQ